MSASSFDIARGLPTSLQMSASSFDIVRGLPTSLRLGRSVLVAPAIEIRRQETEFGAGFSPRCRTSFSGEESNGIDEASRCGSMGRPAVNEGRTALNPEPNKLRPIRPAFFAGHEYLGPNPPRHRLKRDKPSVNISSDGKDEY